MAKAEIVRFLDDMDLKRGVETELATRIIFSVDGTYYQIDLASKNREKFNKALAPFIAVAEPLSGAAAQTAIVEARRTSATTDTEQRKAMRAWWHRYWRQAELPGPQVRGSIPQVVVDAYHRHQGMAP